MKNIQRAIKYVSLSGIILISCTKNFESINTDPNRIDQVSPGTLLNPVIYNVSSFNMQKSDDVTFNLMQVALPFPSATGGLHRYDMAENAGNSTWNTYYLALNSLKEMELTAQKNLDPNYRAIAKVLSAWIFSNLTDCFGDIPMTDALKAEEYELKPKFDTQKDVYTKILADLDSANNWFVTTRAMTFGTDLLYANNVANWKRFGNSLRMRLLLRVSKRAEMNSIATIKEMIDNPTKYPVFTANDQAAVLKISGVPPLASPWGRAIDFTTFRAMSKFFLDNLNTMNDPRRARFATQAKDKNNVNIGYMGIPSGYTGSESQFNYVPSNLNQALVTAPMISVLMSYAELEMIKAEVEFRLGNNTAAKAAYDKGVKAAIEQWGAVMPVDYFNNVNAAYNNTLERIMLQKYYALYFTDYQSWFEYRRTGLPVLPVAAGMLNNQKMPVRFRYPLSVRTKNEDNYQKALLNMGADDINTKLWWEK